MELKIDSNSTKFNSNSIQLKANGMQIDGKDIRNVLMMGKKPFEKKSL
jgi:hypothetical protein